MLKTEKMSPSPQNGDKYQTYLVPQYSGISTKFFPPLRTRERTQYQDHSCPQSLFHHVKARPFTSGKACFQTRVLKYLFLYIFNNS